MADPAPRRLFEALLGGPDRGLPAFRFLHGGEERTWSRGALRAEAEAIGARIDAALGTAHPRGVVAVLARRQEEQVLHALACLAAGRIPAVLTPRTPKLDPAWWAHSAIDVLGRVRPVLILTDLADELIAAAGPGRSLPLASLRTVGPVAPLDVEPMQPSATTAFVQFSSGTTGAKKGVGISLEAVLAQLDVYGATIGLTATARLEGERAVEGDLVASWLPLYHDMGYLTAFMLPLRHGVSVVMLDPMEWSADPGAWVRTVARFGATVAWHPNFAFSHLARSSRRVEGADLSCLRLLANCAEPVTQESQARFLQRFAPNRLRPDVFGGCYAMAETTFAVTHGDPATAVFDPVAPVGGERLGGRLPVPSVGSALPGVRFRIVGEDGREQPEGTLGEIWISAPFLADGYVENPAASAAAFRDGWYLSGDLGYLRGDQLFVLGRVKDLMIVAGHNVFPDDVERIVGEAAGLRPGRVVAFATFDAAIQTERVTVLAEPLDEAAAVDLMGVRTRLQAELQIAAQVELVPPAWLVKSSSGKLARKASAEKWARREGLPAAPGTP
jgi:acyl-CoA synthetase (AMP-forming)/AMP-acid ligase II